MDREGLVVPAIRCFHCKMFINKRTRYASIISLAKVKDNRNDFPLFIQPQCRLSLTLEPSQANQNQKYLY